MTYLQPFISFLHEKNLMSDEINDAITEFEAIEAEKRAASLKLTFGKYKNVSVAELCQNKPGKKYLHWLNQQEWFEKFGELKLEVQRSLGLVIEGKDTSCSTGSMSK